MMTICDECKKRLTCQSLCKKATEYADQDNNPDAWSKIRPTDQIESIQNTKMPDVLETTEIILQFYFLDRMDSKEIASKLYISRQYVNRIIKKYKSILSQNIKKSV